MRDKIKKLISLVESLGLDTQPLRDLLISTDDNLENCSSKIDNLLKEVDKYPPGSSPQQISLLLSNLNAPKREARFKNKNVTLTADNYIIQKTETPLDSDLVNTIQKLGLLADHIVKQQAVQDSKPQLPQQQNLDAERLLQKLDSLSEKVDNIKSVGNKSVEEIDPDLPKMQEAFVNPLDEAEVNNLTSNISISPKKGSSLTSSLKKLRDLRKQ